MAELVNTAGEVPGYTVPVNTHPSCHRLGSLNP